MLLFLQLEVKSSLEMEIASVQGSKSKILINPGQARELGRANGFNSSDRTISRRHVSFFNPSRNQNQAHCLQFEVIGVNPIYVRRHGEVKLFRRFERGEMEGGDLFCVSAKNPVWYTLRNVENGGERVVVENVPESELAGSLESGFEFNGVEDLRTEDVDFSGVDHVKEYGFVVMGHEFDSYPKKVIRNIKNWNWFLDESGEDSEDDENKGKKHKASGKGKRKKWRAKDDDWTGESEDEKDLINKSRMVQKPNCMTRSKDVSKPSKNKSKSKITVGKISASMDDEDMEEEDEDDEMLGGFIVGDDNLDEAEESGDEEEEEEELEGEIDEDEDE